MSELLKYLFEEEDAFKSNARLTSIYSDFSRLKSTNPDGYRANVSAWILALSHASRAGLIGGAEGRGSSLLALRISPKLSSELEVRGLGRPLALGAVFDEAIQAEDFIPLQQFFDGRNSIYLEKNWMNDGFPTPWRIAQWGLRHLGLGRRSSNKLENGDYVVKANAEAAAQRVLDRHFETSTGSPTSNIYSLSTFTAFFSDVLSATHPLSPTDMKILLTFLSRDMNKVVISNASLTDAHTIIKLPSTASSPPDLIAPEDATIAQLQTLHFTLTNQVTALTARAEALDKEARRCASNSSRAQALAALRKKKLATTTLEKRTENLHQIERLISDIDEATTQKDMLSAMEASASVLKDLNARIGGAERVEEVMDALRAQTDQVQDVAGVISEEAAGTVDEVEVDEEFEALEREERERKARELGERLPAAPSETPAAEGESKHEDAVDEIREAIGHVSLDETRNEPAERQPASSESVLEKVSES